MRNPLSAPGCAALAAALLSLAAPAWAAPPPPTTSTPVALVGPESTRAEYKISTGDTLDVAVFQTPDLSRTVTVDSGGKVLLPLIGPVKASGYTANELSQTIAAQLGEKYLKDPQVTVTVKDSNSQKVTVDGAVNEPGIYPLTGPTTLVQAVALAKGTDPKRANARKVAVLRMVDGSRQTHMYDLTAIREGRQPDPMVWPQDIVVVGNSSGKSFLTTLVQLAPLAFIIP